MSDLVPRMAPMGASVAACVVCLRPTLYRVTQGDGFVPICSMDCCRLRAGTSTLAVEREEAREKLAKVRQELAIARTARK